MNYHKKKKNPQKLFGLSDSDSLKIKVEIKPFIEFGVDVKNILATNGANLNTM